MTSLRNTWRLIVAAFTAHPILWVPFLLAALVDAACIGLVWAAPHPPYAAVLAPIIRHFFGEANLHYPTHLWFLYFSMKYTNVAATLLAGAFLSALACALMEQAYWGVRPSPRSALASQRIHYGRVGLTWAATWLIAKLVMDTFLRIAPRSPVALAAGVLLSLVIQAALGYAIPLTVYQDASWWRALVRSAREAWTHPASTLAVTILASAPFIAWALYAPATRVAGWMRPVPEVAVGFVAARWAITAVSDAFLTIGLATLWWVHRGTVRMPARSRRRRRRAAAGPVAAAVLMTAMAGTGCSLEYEGERLTWKAKQAYAAVLQHPAEAPAARMAETMAAYESIAERTRGTVWAAQAHMTIAGLHAARGELAQARERYVRLIREYDQFAPLCLQARLALARSLESDARWDEAIRLYEELPVRHPWTMPAMESPIYVAGLYERQGRKQDAARAYTDAIALYLTWVAQAPTQELVATAKGYLALAYDRRGDWRSAIKTLEALAEDPAAANRPFVLMSLASMYEGRAEDPARARRAYSELVTEFGDHPLAKEAKVRLEHLGIGIVPSEAPEHGP